MLPTKKSTPKADVTTKKILLYGPSKMGKSTWAARSNGLFLVLDPGLDEIQCFRYPEVGVLKTWKDFLTVVAEVSKMAHEFPCLIVDTIDLAYKLVEDSICSEYGEKFINEGKLGYGKGGALARSEFYRALLKLSQLPMGLILISHSMLVRYEEGGSERTKVIPSMPDKAGAQVEGLVDAILYADLDKQVEPKTGEVTFDRVIHTKASQSFHAGSRGGKYLPKKWSLGDYQGFMTAWSESMKKVAAEEAAKAAAPAAERK